MNKKLKALIKKAENFGTEKEQIKFLKKEVPLLFDEITFSDFGELMEELKRDIKKFSKKLDKLIAKKEKEEKKKK